MSDEPDVYKSRIEKYKSARMRGNLVYGQVASALKYANGNIPKASRILGVGDSRIRRFIKSNPDLNAVIRSSKMLIAEKAEENLFEAVNNKEKWATTLALKTLYKDEYSIRNEVTGKDGADLFRPDEESKAEKVRELKNRIDRMNGVKKTNSESEEKTVH